MSRVLASSPRSGNGTDARARHIRREAAISAAINAVISAGFFLLVFHGLPRAPLWGTGGLVADAAPQSFMVALMATLVPGLLARRAPPPGSRVPTLARVVRTAIGNAALMAGAGVAMTAVLALILAAAPAFATALVAKVAYGAVLGAVVTRNALGRLLG